jgi:hypothetical protein
MHSWVNTETSSATAGRGAADGHSRLPCRRPEGALTPTLQMTGQPGDGETVQLVERSGGIAVAEVIPPTPEELVRVPDQIRDRNEATSRTRQFAKLVTGAGLGLRRGDHVEIATIAAMKVAVVSQRETREVQARTRRSPRNDARLLTVDRQTEAAFEGPFNPGDELSRLVARQHCTGSP